MVSYFDNDNDNDNDDKDGIENKNKNKMGKETPVLIRINTGVINQKE